MKYVLNLGLAVLIILVVYIVPGLLPADAGSNGSRPRIDRKIGVYYDQELRDYEYLPRGEEQQSFKLGPGSMALFNAVLQSTFREVIEIRNFPQHALDESNLDGVIVPRIKSFVMVEDKSSIPMFRAEIIYGFMFCEPGGKVIASWEVAGVGDMESKPPVYHPQWPGLATEKAMEMSAKEFIENFYTNPDFIWWNHDLQAKTSSSSSPAYPSADKPMIGSIVSQQILSGGNTRGDIWVSDVSASGTIEHVWAVIIPPTEWRQPSQIISLSFDKGKARYEGSYSGFTLNGGYTVVVFARDSKGIASLPKSTSVIQTVLTGIDAYEVDNTPAQATRLWIKHNIPDRHNFHERGDVDWIIFVALKGVTYTIKVENQERNADLKVELYDTNASSLLDSVELLLDRETGIRTTGKSIIWTAATTGILYIKTMQIFNKYGVDTAYDLTISRSNVADNWDIKSVWNNICHEANAGSGPAQILLAYWHRTDLITSKAPLFRSELQLDDRVAYMWYRLAEENKALGAIEGRQHMSTRLSHEELIEAEQMAHDWKPGQCPSPHKVEFTETRPDI